MRVSTAIDWDAAARRAATIARPGPTADRGELLALVAELHEAAGRAPAIVGDVTGLHEAAGAAARGPVHVIDRPSWVGLNLQVFRALVGDVLPVAPGPAAARLAGEELGLVLGFLASKVLGQFDPFTASPAGDTGRLVLVAPNVLRTERELGFSPSDFRLWVCLHEQTHAVQFAAAPWLAEHLSSRVRGLVETLQELSRDHDRLRGVLSALPRVLRGEPVPGSAGGSAHALLDVVLDEEHRSAVADVVAVMSLLEGHADVVMDAGGPELIPTLPEIRSRFEARRDGKGRLDVLMRRILGLDAKVAQYRTGAAFVRGVLERVGHEGLNVVWRDPRALPSAAEILDPGAWVSRVRP